jgi:hypothetical protein
VYVEYDNNAFPYPQTIGSTANSIAGLGPADETMMKIIFIMPNKSTSPDATMMIVVDEKDPSTDPKTYQYVYVGDINDLPSDVLTEGSIVNDLSTGGTDKPLSAEQGRTLNSHVNYTTCGSGAGDQVKLISDDGFELSTHLRLLVLMTNTNTNSTPKFNINNTGVKDVWYNGAVASDTNTWDAGEILDVYYDGTKYIANTHGGAQFSTGEKVGDVSIVNIPGTELKSVMSQRGVIDLTSEYNVSANNNNTEYTFAQAVALVPASLQKGGLTIKYIDNTTHEYVVKRLMSSTWNTTESNWQGSETTKNIDSNGFISNSVGSISINQRQSSVSKPFKNVGYAILGANGKMAEYPTYACTDLLPVIDNIKIGVISNYGGFAAVAFYNSDKSFLSTIFFATIGELSVFHEYTPQIPEDAAYFAVTTLKDEIINSYVLFGNVENYLADKVDFPELMHTVYDADLVREHKFYNDAGVSITTNDIDSVKLNVSEGDVLRITCSIGSSANYHAVKFYTNGGTLIEAKLLDGDFVNCKLVVPTDATFAICQGRNANAEVNPNHIQLKVDLYSKYKDAEEIVDERLIDTSELSFSVDGKYIGGNGALYANTSYHCTDYQFVNEDDVVNVTAYAGSPLLVMAGYDSNKNFVQSLLSSGTYNNYQITIPSGISYIRVCGKKLVEGNTIDAKAILLKEKYATIKQLNELQSPIVYDALMLEPCQGYYNKNLGLACATSTLGYRISAPIPIMVGDVVTAGTTISYPFDTVAHVLLDANKTIIGTFNMSNGICTITQAMWNSGARYVAISFKPTDTPSLTITRSANAEPFVLDRTLRMKINPYTNGFILWIPSNQNSGKYVGYRFVKYYKKWDSLEYEDADGNTQTLTDVVNTDVWNCLEIYDENMHYIMQGNTNFIFAFDGQNHAGDGHGNEVALFTQFIIDGKIKEITSTGYFGSFRIIELNSFECIWKSEVYRQGGGVSEAATAKPYVKTDGTLELNAMHYLNAKFEYGNKIKINNSLEIKQDNVTFYGIYGAMLECYFGNFSYIQVNNDENSITQIADDGESSLVGGSTINLAPGEGGTGTTGVTVAANEVKMWGKNFVVTQRMESKYNQSINNLNIYIHKYADRLKAYLQPVKARGASAGEKEVFNSGDVISVIDYREIEV